MFNNSSTNQNNSVNQGTFFGSNQTKFGQGTFQNSDEIGSP